MKKLIAAINAGEMKEARRLSRYFAGWMIVDGLCENGWKTTDATVMVRKLK